MTEQEVFSTSICHLRKQGRRSEKEYGGRNLCCYRGPNGTKCAVGALIPDEVYDPKMEGLGASNVIRRYEGLAHLKAYSRLLADLQLIHDRCSVQDWESRWEYLAKAHGLEMPPK